MRKIKLLTLAALLLSFTGCDDDDYHGDWAKAPSFGGEPRTAPVSFVIKENGQEYAYVGLGVGDKTTEFTNFKRYDYSNGSWEDVVSPPAEFRGRHSAVAFVIGSKAYVGTGFISGKTGSDGAAVNHEYLKDFWCYDASIADPAQRWSKVADEYPGRERRNAVAFTIGNYAYVGTGITENGLVLKDFYIFDGTTETWVGTTSLLGSEVHSATAFVVHSDIYNKEVAYVCLGSKSSSGSPSMDNNIFIPGGANGAGEWDTRQALADKPSNKQDKDYGRIPRVDGVSFIITRGKTSKERVFIAGGAGNRTTWYYDHNKDLWWEVENVPFSSQAGAVGFSLNGYGFIMGGATGQDATTGQSRDMWMFIPDVREDRSNDYSTSVTGK